MTSKVIWGLCVVGVCVGTAQNASAQSTFLVDVDSTPPGATVYVDSTRGDALGTTPLSKVSLRRGNHVLYFLHEGHEELRLYVDVSSSGQRFSAYLKPLAHLELTAGNDSSKGGKVIIDGEEVGSLPFAASLKSGRHMVQVIKDGYESYNQWLELVAGQKQSIPVALEAIKKQAGSILVTSNVAGAEVFLDGVSKGRTPSVIRDVPVGTHTVQIQAMGKLPFSAQVVVSASKRVSVNPTLENDRHGNYGEIVVNASVGGAFVSVDGQAKGSAPVVVRKVNAGRHKVKVQAEGYLSFEASCLVRIGEACEVNAKLVAVGVPVRVEADVESARLFLDGRAVSSLPFEGHLPEGNHSLEVRAEGFEPFVEQVFFSESKTTRLFDVSLKELGAEGEHAWQERISRIQQRRRYGATSYSAVPLPVDQAILDLSAGWPFLGELRLAVGILENLQIGFAGRSFGRLTEFEARAKWGSRVLEYVAFAAQLRLGGGLGPSEQRTNPSTSEKNTYNINTWFAAIEGIASINFSDRGAFSLWLGLDMYTDRYDFSGLDGNVVLSPRPGRQDQSRLRLGGSLELAMSRNWNVFAVLEGVLWGPSADRRILGDILNIGKQDTELYFRVGGTYKF
ncbi:MAG: PEGA domain-containing protein [Myxococcales bacterium]|nr:MAG: PEGA domain-containing protein [Myxococcales bacterium]